MKRIEKLAKMVESSLLGNTVHVDASGRVLIYNLAERVAWGQHTAQVDVYGWEDRLERLKEVSVDWD